MRLRAAYFVGLAALVAVLGGCDRRTRVIPRAQRQNKLARILTHAPYVMDNVFFPRDWAERWPAFYRAMSGFRRAARNAHDDAPDAVTGLCEMIEGGRTRFASGEGERRYRERSRA